MRERGIYFDEHTDGSWKIREGEENTVIADMILWHPSGGLISSDGKNKMSSAAVLLHELGHTYYDACDPDGLAEIREGILNSDIPEADKQAKLKELDSQNSRYDTADDKWIIQNVETKFKKDWHRKDHSEGYFLKTKGGSFSRRGREAGFPAQEDLTKKELKKGVRKNGDPITRTGYKEGK